MTKENKLRLLSAFDTLNLVRDLHQGKRGGTFSCAMCGHNDAIGGPHPPTCRVDEAIKALSCVIPRYSDRDKWLDSEYPKVITDIEPTHVAVIVGPATEGDQ